LLLVVCWRVFFIKQLTTNNQEHWTKMLIARLLVAASNLAIRNGQHKLKEMIKQLSALLNLLSKSAYVYSLAI
jgi:hypothetical protein